MRLSHNSVNINIFQRNMKHLWAIIFTVLLRFTGGQEEQEANCADIGTVSRVQEVQEDCHVTVENIVTPMIWGWMVVSILLLSFFIIICSIIYIILYIYLAELVVVDIETIDI